MSAGGAAAPAAATGLVSSAISETSVPDLDLSGLLAGLLSFPTAEMLSTAAALFPVPELRGVTLGWSRAARSYSDRLSGTEWEPKGASLYVEHKMFREGQWPRVEISPGLVRFRRVDLDAADRALDRAQERKSKAPLLLATTDDDWEGVEMADGEGATRELVTGWSAKSRARLVAKIASLDLAPLVTGATPPAMVTLTLPDRWLEVTPDAETAAAAFHRWASSYRRKWGVPLRCIWKREFQRRGAPHWHLWMVPPAEGKVFREWLSESWTRSLRISDPEERRKSLAAGTGVDVAEGMRARDPKRLAVYFLKESLGGEGKAYQNLPPAEWAGQSVGRYWGVRGIAEAVETVELDPRDYAQLWRAARHVREASAGSRVQLVPRGVKRSGEVRYRRVNRRVRVRAAAGFVTVNDGASFAAELARYAGQLADSRL